MKIVIYFLIIFVYLSSSLDSKDIGLNFVVSGLGGANYFVWTDGSSSAYTGWGESYGYEGEVQMIFKKKNIGLGLSCGNIYETAIARPPWYEYIIWERKVRRTFILGKILLYASKTLTLWIGFGYDNFEITYGENRWLDRGKWYRWRLKGMEGAEIFEVFAFGTDVRFFKNFILSGEVKIGSNQTSNTIEKGDYYQSWQYVLGLGYEFDIIKSINKFVRN